MRKCDCCGRRRKYTRRLAVPVEYVANYRTGEKRTLAVGSVICRDGWRSIMFSGTIEGCPIKKTPSEKSDVVRLRDLEFLEEQASV